MKKFSFWVNQRITKSVIRLLAILVPFVFVGICFLVFLFAKHEINNTVRNINFNIVTGLKTGDKVLIDKTISAIKTHKQINSFKLMDKNQNVYIDFYNNNDIHSYLEFKDIFLLKDSQNSLWGSLSISWHYDYTLFIFLLFIFSLSTILLFFVFIIVSKKSFIDLIQALYNIEFQVESNNPNPLFLNIIELNEIFKNLVESRKNLLTTENLKSQLKLNAHLTELSKKLAHDIRSPLSTLNMIAFQMQNEDLKSMQIQVMNQINQIADDVLKEGRNINSQITMNTHKIEHSESIAISNKQKYQDQDTLIAINPFFDSLNKEYEFKSIALKQKIIFVNNVKDKNYSISKSLSSVLYRTINNCIQNSVEATANISQALISIEFNNSDNSQKELKMTIKDNGKGIPATVLTSLGHKPLSYGKDGSDQSGNGIAVYNAKKDLEHHKSTLYIDSVEGVGTTVTLLCPVYS